jgi:hypothetical protein
MRAEAERNRRASERGRATGALDGEYVSSGFLARSSRTRGRAGGRYRICRPLLGGPTPRLVCDETTGKAARQATMGTLTYSLVGVVIVEMDESRPNRRCVLRRVVVKIVRSVGVIGLCRWCSGVARYHSQAAILSAVMSDSRKVQTHTVPRLMSMNIHTYTHTHTHTRSDRCSTQSLQYNDALLDLCHAGPTADQSEDVMRCSFKGLGALVFHRLHVYHPDNSKA